MNYSPRYLDVQAASIKMNENNDCSIKAAVILTGFDYETVHHAFSVAGREPRKATAERMTIEAYNHLGFHLKLMDHVTMDRLRPKNFKSITTFHPIRFPELWDDWRSTPLLVHSRSHAVAWKNGRMHCWAEQRAYRIKKIWMLESQNDY